jgi:hypothetical protein
MRTALKKSIWDYMVTLPDWLEVTIWIAVLIMACFFVIAIASGIAYFIYLKRNKDTNKKPEPKRRNEHQIEHRRESDKKEIIEAMKNSRGPWAFLTYCVTEQKPMLAVILLAIFLMLSVSFNIKDGLTIKPGIKAEDLKGVKK